MPLVQFYLGDRLYSGLNLSGYLDGGRGLFAEARPKAVNGKLRVLYSELDPELAYGGELVRTLKGWEELESRDLKLARLAAIVASYEVNAILATRVLPAMSVLSYTLELAYRYRYLADRGVTGVEDRFLGELGRKIRGNLRSLDKLRFTPRSGDSYERFDEIMRELGTAVMGHLAELRLCQELYGDFQVSFNTSRSGADLLVEDVRVEVTSVAGGYGKYLRLSGPCGIIDLRGLIKGAVVPKARRKFGQGDVVVVDLTSNVLGFLLVSARALLGDEVTLDLGDAMESALRRAKEGGRAVVAYARLRDIRAALTFPA